MPHSRAQAKVSPLAVVLARLLLRVFFRQTEVIGASGLSADRPLVLVANHVNSLVDPGMLLAYLPRAPRFLSKSTLWQHPIIRPLLELGAAIPVYRRQDPGVDPARNEESFARCHEVLAAGGVIALFPEGTSHNEPALVPLKTGVSRIVLQAEDRFGPLGIQIVPIGLVFDAKTTFRSRALMVVGEPLDLEPELGRYTADPRAAVRSLTTRVQAALEEVTLNFPSWREARLIERAAEIWEQPDPELPARPPLSEAVEVRRAFIEGYGALKEQYPDEVSALSERVAAYDEALATHRLGDEQLASRYPVGGVLRFVAHSLGLLLLRLPLALVGTLIGFVPYHLASWVARRWGTSDDLLATYKLLASMVFHPIVWLLGALAIGWRWGPWPAIGFLVLAPFTGWVAFRFHERRSHFRRQARAFLVLHTRPRQIAELRNQRSRLLADIRALAERWEGS